MTIKQSLSNNELSPHTLTHYMNYSPCGYLMNRPSPLLILTAFLIPPNRNRSLTSAHSWWTFSTNLLKRLLPPNQACLSCFSAATDTLRNSSNKEKQPPWPSWIGSIYITCSFPPWSWWIWSTLLMTDLCYYRRTKGQFLSPLSRNRYIQWENLIARGFFSKC